MPDSLPTFHALWAAYRMREATALLPGLLESGLTTEASLGIAKALHARGRFKAALPFAKKAASLDPSSSATGIIHAELLERCGDFTAAREVIAPLLSSHSPPPRAVRLEAHIRRREGQFASAADLLERQLADHPSTADDWRLLYELAAVKDRLGDFSGAFTSLLSAKDQLKTLTMPHRQQWRRRAAFQWELTRSLTAALVQRWRAPGEPDPEEPQVCLMAGFPRSGTTLLETLLTAHPDCIGTDESGILATQFRDDIVFGAGSPAEALGEIDGFESDELEAGRQEYFRATGEFTEAGDLKGRTILEKDPLLTADLPLPLRLFPSCKLLMPLRDPRDVLISYFFTIVPLNWSGAAAGSMADSALCYAETMRHWFHLRKILDPACWLESRYEELVGDPAAEMQKLRSFLKLSLGNESHCHRDVSDRIMRTPTYDDVRKPVYRGSVGRWQHYAQWLEPHLPVLAPAIRQLGYAL